MEYPFNKQKIISLLTQSLQSCPCRIDCLALFGSVVKEEIFRDVDILIVVPATNEVKIAEDWARKIFIAIRNLKIDIKGYDYETFINMVREKTSFALSLAVEVEYLVPNSNIESELKHLRQYLLSVGIDTSNNSAWKVVPKISDNILDEANLKFRGFLVSHLSRLADKAKAKRLLGILAPLEEPYTRVACFKQTIKLISNEEYRQQLKVSVQEAIEIASLIVANRSQWDSHQLEDYSRDDLCIELVEALADLPAGFWPGAKILIEHLFKDYHHFVRQNTARLIHHQILPANPALGFCLLVAAYEYEKNYYWGNAWILSEISDKPFFTDGSINAKQLYQLLNGYIQSKDNPETLTFVQAFQQFLVANSLPNFKADVDTLFQLFDRVADLQGIFMKISQPEEIYLANVLGNLKSKRNEAIFAAIIQQDGINLTAFNSLLSQPTGLLPSQAIHEIFDFANRLSKALPIEAEYYVYEVRLLSMIRQAEFKIPKDSRTELLRFVLQKMAMWLTNAIKNFNLSRFFSVTPKPRFGFKIGKSQSLKFIIRNLSATEIPDFNLEIQSSAELEIVASAQYHFYFYKPHEERVIECRATPHVAKQIAVSYKINSRFGEPLYISAERDNPFVPNQPAHRAHFVGREHELQKIREEIHQQHFLLFGPRRIGKTSLLYQLKDELQAGYVPIYLSLQKFDKLDGASLFDEVIREAIRELTGGSGLSVSKFVSPYERIEEIKNYMQEKRLALLIDELDVGLAIKDFAAFLERMRAMMQQTTYIRVIFSSGPFITRALVDPQSPLFNMVSSISINRFTSEAAERLLRLAEDHDIIFEKDAIEECLAWTGNLPLYLQIMGDRFYQTLKDKEVSSRRVNTKLIAQVKKMMASDVLEWERLWNTLNPLEKAILAFCAYQGDTIDVQRMKRGIENLLGRKFSFAHIKTSLSNLVWHGLLYRNDEGNYALTATLVQNWLTSRLYYPEEIQDLFHVANDNDIERSTKSATQLFQSY